MLIYFQEFTLGLLKTGSGLLWALQDTVWLPEQYEIAFLEVKNKYRS